jgi:hypothetical protein
MDGPKSRSNVMSTISTLVDLSRWQTALTVLSLERAVPFWAGVGLAVQEASCVREAAQAAVTGLWSSDRSEAAVGRLVDEFLSQIEHRCGEGTRRLVLKWADGVFALAYESRAGAQATLWRPLLNALCGLRAGRPVAPFEIVPIKKAALVAQLRSCLAGEVDESVYDAHVPSLWDREVEKVYGDGSPMDWVGGVSRFVTTQQALNAVVATFDGAGMRTFMEWAARQAPLHGWRRSCSRSQGRSLSEARALGEGYGFIQAQSRGRLQGSPGAPHSTP